MSTIFSQTDGAPAQSQDEFVINRSGADFKLSHATVVAGVTALITAEQAARIAADLTLTNSKVDRSGDIMSGYLTLHAAPSSDLHASTKKYADDKDALRLALTGGTVTGPMFVTGAYSNVNSVVPKTYIDTEISGRWKNAANLNCSGNPNYSASKEGDTIRVTTGGKIGGASGKSVDTGDFVYCHTTDFNGGVESVAGSNYIVIAGKSANPILPAATNTEIDAGVTDFSIITPLGARRIVSRLVPSYNKVTINFSSYSIPASAQSSIFFLASSSSRDITLPVISSISGDKNITIQIKDTAMAASSGNITINAGAGNFIDKLSSYLMTQNGQCITLVNDSSTNWYII